MADMDLARLDLNLLVALDALLRHEGVGAAAQELHLSQPALSRSLARLRELLGDPLLVRIGRGMVPTERARSLREPVAHALDAARRVFAPPARFEPALARGSFSIGLGEEAQVAFADAIVQEIWAEAPGIDLRIRGLSADSVDQGRRGEIDLAIGPDLAALPPTAGAIAYDDFVARRLYTRRFLVASRDAGPRDLDAYCAASHVIVSFEGGGWGFVDELLARLDRRRRVAACVTSFPSAAALVERTGLLATLPEEVLLTCAPGLHRSRPPFALPELPMLMLWHPRTTADPRQRFLRERVARAVTRRVASWGA